MLLNITAILTGACVLILEVSATRVLSPYFGSSLYTISSILSVVLGGLSIGYWYGGKIADKHPQHVLLYQIIFGSGITVLLAKALTSMLLPYIGNDLPVDTGPILMSALLLLIPSILLGAVSPFIIKLKQRSSENLGQTAGSLFFFSTMGSILGSLASGFFFIPKFGISTTINATGVLLCLIGLCGLWPKNRASNPVIVSVVICLFSWYVHSQIHVNLLLDIDTQYSHIQVLNTTINDTPTRVLMQDRNLSAAMYLSKPDLVFEYTKYIALAKQISPLEHVLVIGSGAYSIPKWLLTNTQASIETVDIDPELESIATQHFSLVASPRLTTITQDGRRFISHTSQKYDCVFLDAYSELTSIPSHLTTKEFFHTLQTRLRPHGIIIANVIGSTHPAKSQSLIAQWSTITSIFPHTQLIAVKNVTSTDPQNFIVVASNNPFPPQSNTVSLTPNSAAILTDDKNPLQLLTLPLLKS